MSINNNTIAIIVTYNRLSLLKECLSNIDTGKEKSDILLIDNNSDDGTYEYINKFNKIENKDLDVDLKELIDNIEVLKDINIYKFSCWRNHQCFFPLCIYCAATTYAITITWIIFSTASIFISCPI